MHACASLSDEQPLQGCAQPAALALQVRGTAHAHFSSAVASYISIFVRQMCGSACTRALQLSMPGDKVQVACMVC